MGEALLFGAIGSSALVLGAVAGGLFEFPKRVLAAMLAFASGALITALAFELFEDSHEQGGLWRAGLGLLAGAVIFTVLSQRLDRAAQGHRPESHGSEKLDVDAAAEEKAPSPASVSGAAGLALLAAVTLDGVPENVALGISMDQGGLVLLVAIAVGNTPEAISSGAYLRTEMDMERRRGMLLWAATGVLLVLATVGADAAAGSIGPASIAAIQAFAGGATIAVLADTLMPQAYKEGGWWVGLATALGFLVAFMLG